MTTFDPCPVTHDQITGLNGWYLIVGCSCGWEIRIMPRSGCMDVADTAHAEHVRTEA